MISGLDSATLKIVRAEEHLDAINRLIDAATSRADSYEIIKDANGKEIVNFLVAPPPEVAILTGEIVYHLRSAMDHLAFDLVKLNPSGSPLPVNWEEKCCFPLRRKVPKNTAYNFFGDDLPGISMSAFTFIESMQPYHSGEGPHNVIKIIAQLSNADKHRHLNAVLSRVAVRQDFKSARGLQSTTIVGGFTHGAEVQSAIFTRGGQDPTVDMKRTFLPYLTFEELAIGAGPASLEAQSILELCVEQVKRVILPAFINLLKKP
ncbi:MAG TPA: hypothetical protein VK805_12975 [Candidatus Baltobacteraceae bacterium]|jgi:hypothetical protein|nr:hypothetical protein [Candidatus Baltobacteraceae bacterium]